MSEHFGECVHVNKTELPKPAKDTEIWNYAAANGYTIITQDSDFLHLFEAKGFPPKIVLLRVGNIDRKTAEKILLHEKSSIIDLETVIMDCLRSYKYYPLLNLNGLRLLLLRNKWQRSKNEINIREHKISFETASIVFDDPLAVVVYDFEHSCYNEDRYRLTGFIPTSPSLFTVCFTIRAELTRIFSAPIKSKGINP